MVISEPLAIEDLVASPWKNGGGITRTVAVEPSDASMDSFLWRVSLAEVHAPGSFSRFVGIDRTILLWSGNGLRLHSPDWSHTLDRPYVPFQFSGEEEIHSSLVGGATVDLNVMVRRGVAQALVRVKRNAVTISDPVETMVVLCATGRLEIQSDGDTLHVLGANEFLRVDRCEAGTILAPSSSETIFITISLAARKSGETTEDRALAYG